MDLFNEDWKPIALTVLAPDTLQTSRQIMDHSLSSGEVEGGPTIGAMSKEYKFLYSVFYTSDRKLEVNGGNMTHFTDYNPETLDN